MSRETSVVTTPPTEERTILTANITPRVVNYVYLDENKQTGKSRVKRSKYSGEYNDLLKTVMEIIQRSPDDYVQLQVGGSIQVYHKQYIKDVSNLSVNLKTIGVVVE